MLKKKLHETENEAEKELNINMLKKLILLKDKKLWKNWE